MSAVILESHRRRQSSASGWRWCRLLFDVGRKISVLQRCGQREPAGPGRLGGPDGD